MRYGVPYKGSKNKIAEKIIDVLPQANNLYDLFAGGCAITHCALLNNKWNKIFANDIEKGIISLFSNALNGKYSNEKRWISREDFYNNDCDAYVQYLWSFGNNGRNYLYSREIEPWKKALHYAIVFDDYSLFEQMSIFLPKIDCDNITKRRAEISRYIKKHKDELKNKYIDWYCEKIINKKILRI